MILSLVMILLMMMLRDSERSGLRVYVLHVRAVTRHVEGAVRREGTSMVRCGGVILNLTLISLKLLLNEMDIAPSSCGRGGRGGGVFHRRGGRGDFVGCAVCEIIIR